MNYYKNITFSCIFFLTLTEKCTCIRLKWIKVDNRGAICSEEAHFTQSIQKGV